MLKMNGSNGSPSPTSTVRKITRCLVWPKMYHYSRTDEGILVFRLEWRRPYCFLSTNIDLMVRMRSMRTVKSMLVRGGQYGPSHERRTSKMPESYNNTYTNMGSRSKMLWYNPNGSQCSKSNGSKNRKSLKRALQKEILQSKSKLRLIGFR